MSLMLAACSGDPTGPSPSRPGGLGNDGGNGGTGTGASSLVGVWRSVVVVEVTGDIQTWTTTWRFDADGACRQTIVTESLVEGFPRTTERVCTWTSSGFEVTIAFAGGGSLTFDYAFAGLSPDRLVLDGQEYERQP